MNNDENKKELSAEEILGDILKSVKKPDVTEFSVK